MIKEVVSFSLNYNMKYDKSGYDVKCIVINIATDSVLIIMKRVIYGGLEIF